MQDKIGVSIKIKIIKIFQKVLAKDLLLMGKLPKHLADLTDYEW